MRLSSASRPLVFKSDADYYWVNRHVDETTPQAVQRMNCEELMLFVVKQQKLTCKAMTSDKAGAFELHLNRLFEKLGSAKAVKDDRLDCAGLCQSLSCNERVNRKAFSPVWITALNKGLEEGKLQFTGNGRDFFSSQAPPSPTFGKLSGCTR